MSCKKELLSFLRGKPREFRVVVLPDFFLDRILQLDFEPSEFSSILQKTALLKGGSIDDIVQMDIRGGNAVNTASTLLALGARVAPLICTSKRGLSQLKTELKSRLVDLTYVKLLPRASLTTALEFQSEKGKSNVMLRDVGSLSDFGPENLTERDYQLIEDTDYVCLFNWAGTKKFGTSLAQVVFRRTKGKGRGKTYFDTADPNPNFAGIPQLIDVVLKTPYVDILSLNENEAITYANYIRGNRSAERKGRHLSDLALDSARILVQHLKARIDLHTTDFSATLSEKKEVVVPVFNVTPFRATGAGDAWNAGNILGDANSLSDECRLALANAVSASYLTSPKGLHPTREELAAFIEKSNFLAIKT